MNPLSLLRGLITNRKPLTRGVLFRTFGGKAIVSTTEGSKIFDIETNGIKVGSRVDIDGRLITQRNTLDNRIITYRL